MKVSQILLCVFLSVNITTAYSSELMDDGTYLDFLNPQLANLGLLNYEQVLVDDFEVQKILNSLSQEGLMNGSIASSPDLVAFPAVTKEQIDTAIKQIVDNQPVIYDALKGYGVANCVYCRKGFGEYGKEKTAVSKIKIALTRHYNNDHRSDIVYDKIYKN